MTFETARQAVDFLAANAQTDNSTPDITFFGGEPLLRWDDLIKPLVLYIREELRIPCTLSITSNCVLMDEEKLAFMQRYKIGLLFSIDGDRETQDYNRPTHSGDGSFSLLEDKIDAIVGAFPSAPFRSTCIPATCAQTWHNMQFAIDAGFKTIYTVPNVYEPWSECDKDTLLGCLHAYSEYFVDCFRGGTQPAIFTSIEAMMARIPTLQAAVQLRQVRKNPFCLGPGKCGLAAGRNCSIAPDGSIYGCQELTSNDGPDSIFYIGNLTDGVDDARRIALTESYHADQARAAGLNCGRCALNVICDGGCAANNYLISGDIHVNPDVYCWWRQKLLDESMWILQTLGKEENELFRTYWRKINGKR